MEEEIRDHCGLFGCYGSPLASEMTRLGLFAEQHRGQESAGIVTFDGEKFYERLRMGLVSEQFSYKDARELKGYISSGHVRYSTTGGSSPRNIQPLPVEIQSQKWYISHNGNLHNYHRLKQSMESNGSIFSTTTDSEIIAHLIASSKKQSFEDKIDEACSQLRGAYSLLFMTPDSLIGVRDPAGIRPLILGKKENAYFLASETPAFDVNDIKYVREIEPGEMIIFNSKTAASTRGYETRKLTAEKVKSSECIFEHVYFRRPDSLVGENLTVWSLRFRMGQRLAEEFPVDADIVGPIPDSGNSAAEGFAQRSGITYSTVFVRNHYIGRTFILPEDDKRKDSIDLKLGVNRGAVYGKRVVVVDDSIVRGNTTRKKVNHIRLAGAKEVHVRISCPPVRHPCFDGMDFPTETELIANKMLNKFEKVNLRQLAEYLGADSVGYLPLEGLLWACEPIQRGFCTACFDGNYSSSQNTDLRKGIC